MAVKAKLDCLCADGVVVGRIEGRTMVGLHGSRLQVTTRIIWRQAQANSCPRIHLGQLVPYRSCRPSLEALQRVYCSIGTVLVHRQCFSKERLKAAALTFLASFNSYPTIGPTCFDRDWPGALVAGASELSIRPSPVRDTF